MKKALLVFPAFLIFALAGAQSINPLPPLPTTDQLKWHEMEFYLFVHFGPNTFTGLEWGKGTEKSEIFDPSSLDCRQWAKIAKEAGAKGILITAKHHDGFCLWPSKYSTHTVAQSDWKNGKGDVLRDLSNACKEYGLRMGVYLSPWDRNHPDYGTDLYNDVFVNMMKEVVESYGPFFEFWWDGANGEGPNGKKQVYDWPHYISTLREIAPHTLIFSDIGPDIRWIGNEKGIAGKTNWNLLTIEGFTPGAGAPSPDTLNRGNKYGTHWIPGECDVSIRPGWFYHAEEDSRVKSGEQLFQLYLKSVGRGATFLLNVPPDTRGLFHSNDSVALMEFKRLIETNFEQNQNLIQSVIIKGKDVTKSLNDQNNGFVVGEDPVELKLKKSAPVNCVVLTEPVAMGQRVSKFTVLIKQGNTTVSRLNGTTIGRKRILTFPTVEADKIEILINESKAIPLLGPSSIYKIDDDLIEK